MKTIAVIEEEEVIYYPAEPATKPTGVFQLPPLDIPCRHW